MSPLERNVRDFVLEQNDRIKMLRLYANAHVRSGGVTDLEGWPGYEKALAEIRAFIETEMPSRLYIDQDGDVVDLLPEEEPDDYRYIEKDQITRICFGTLLNHGGL